MTGRGHCSDLIGRDVGDVGFPAPDGRDLGGIDIQADRVQSGLGELHDERQSDISETDDTDPRPFGANLFE